MAGRKKLRRPGFGLDNAAAAHLGLLIMHGHDMDPDEARAAFDELRPTLDQLDDLQHPPADIEEAAAQALVVGRRVKEPAVRERFAGLIPAGLDIGHVDHLEKIALATLHAVFEHRNIDEGDPRKLIWANHVQRAWTLLLITYDEVSAAGHLLYRNDHGVARFPPLVLSSQSGHGDSRPDPETEAEILSYLSIQAPARSKPS